MAIQSVSDWKKSLTQSTSSPAPTTQAAPTGGVQSVSQWKSTRPAVAAAAPAPAAPVKPPSFIDNVVGGAKHLLGDVTTALTAPPAPKSLDMQTALKTGWDTIVNTVQDTAKRLQAPLPNISQSPKEQFNNAIGVGEGAIGLLNTAFLGITAPLQSAANVPGVGYLADAANNVFNAIGKGGSGLAEGAVEALPVSQETKDKIKPLAEEVGALFAQILAGKLGGEGVKTVTEKSKQIIDAIHSDVKAGKVNAPAPTEAPQAPTQVQSIAEWKAAGKPTAPADVPTGIAQLHANATAYLPDFKAAIDSVAKEGGYTVEPDPLGVKTPDSLTRKANVDYGGDFTQIRDANRATLIVKDPATDLQKIVDSIVAHGGEVSRDVKNKFNENGYKSAIINIKTPHGHNAEIAVTTPEMWHARITLGGDILHKTMRNLEHNTAEYHRIEAASKALYDRAWSDSLARLKSSSVTGEPSRVATSGGYAVPDAVVAKTTSRTGSRSTLMDTPSFSKNLGKSAISDNVPHKGEKSKPVDSTPTETSGSPKAIKGTGDKFTSRVFERMQAENPQIEGGATVRHMNMQEDAARAVELVATDKQKAYQIAMGAETSPDVTSTAVNIAMSEKALADGNYDLAAKLIKNRSLEQTRRGQEIVTERGSINDNSTARYVKELVAARLDALGKGYLNNLKLKGRRVADKTKAIERIDQEVKKVQGQIKSKKLDTKTALALLDKLSCI